MRALVCGLPIELSPCRRAHAGTRGVCRSFHGQPLGREVQSPARRGVSPPQAHRVYQLAVGRDVYQDQRPVVLLYRAVDKYGQTIDLLLTEQRDKQAALRFLKKAIRRHGMPEKITIDGSEANASAITSYNKEHGTLILIRQVKDLHHIVEQDHRGVKRVTRPTLDFKAFDAAQHTLAGVELMRMSKKKQLVVEAENEDLTAAEQFYALAI